LDSDSVPGGQLDSANDSAQNVFVDMDSDGVWDGDTNVCAEANVEFELDIPTVILLIDQSGTMEEQFGDTSRWNAVYQALFDPNTGVVAALESDIRFGMQLYTSTDQDAADGNCPILTGVAPAMNNYATMNSVFENTSPVEDTPTGESIDQVVEMLLADPEPGRKIILLATDGLPDSCAIPDPRNQAESNETEALAIQAAQNAYANNIPVFVISVGDDVGAAHLSQLANAGQGFDVDDPNGATYYVADQPADLEAAFGEIISGVRNCVLALEGEVEEDLADSCTVTADNVALEFNSENGWRLNNTSEIEVVGATCEGILNGSISSLSVTCPCGVYTGPVI
jgi:hypothetical protein